MEGNRNKRAGKMVDMEALARDALKPDATDDIFVQSGDLFTEFCARWIQSNTETESKIAAFGRILPLAPHLAEHVERFLARVSNSSILGSQESGSPGDALALAEELELVEILLGAFRLLSYDCRDFAKYVRPLTLESLFQHSSRVVRYLAVRVFCLYVYAADHATQEMARTYVGEGEIEGPWEGKVIDYQFLALWEEKRWKGMQSRLSQRSLESSESVSPSLYQQLSPYTVNINGILLPRLDGEPSQERSSELIPTATTEVNLNNIAQGLLGHSPILLTGLAGSGKTLLTRHFAWQLNKLEKMVTLHLNEQSDAKLLIGMYATGSKPGTFSWRPGVLTTAVREGRWIFIEDLDRAPNEVISTLLPLIERGELLIPSRGETVRAARGFRIIATMRSTLNPRGQEIIPRQNMIGHRFWNSITVQMPRLDEFEKVIAAKYPALQKHLGGIMGVYSRLLKLYSDVKFSSENGTSIRAMTPRDLLKWCDRIAVLLAQTATFNTAQKDDIFMEAFDCFAGSLQCESARLKVMACVAEELHIDPQRRHHLLKNRTVTLSVPSKTTSSGTIQIGRARLAKHRSSKRPTAGRPFSTNDYTLRLLEKVAVAVDRQEPLLLVGETGTGKTTCIQYLAEQLGRKLVAFNLSQQSESGDLLGGFKPVNVRSLVIPLKDEFDDLFDATFSRKKNLRFIEMLGKRVVKGEWKRVCTLWREALKMVDAARKAHESQASSPDPDGGQPKKKRKTDSLPANFPKSRWEKFATDLHDLEAQLASGSEAFAFSFLEGNIVKAVRNGDWVLLDEINLASSDTLEALTDLLGGGPDGNPSILLTETGNVERVVAHPNFRVFAAMNPATDVGKKDLPAGIRSRFTELYVESPDSDEKSLRNIVEKYLGGDKDATDPAIVRAARDVTTLYLEIQKLAKANMLVDGADQKPHFSLRTLTRTLSYAREMAPLCSVRRALFEGFHMNFLTFLSKASEDLVAPLIIQHLFPQKAVMKAELGKALQQPSDGRSYVREGHYWLRQGVQPVEEQPQYIITPFVQRNMNNLIRATSTRKYPVLIQGPTSSGKTSMIEYLAKRSGNKFVRINNHEHTDLQEYLGSYISGSDGKLVFQEGILVQALREGHWIVLDELNLAPTDVLEALNRLLDDNRELLIPETQEVVRPHEDFMLFATQNPAGLYGGRKVLSRAFRNRFLELHFDDIPVEELTEILHRRTMIPETWCKRIVKVYKELSTLRQENRIFEQKSFATLRDLFRWAQRKAATVQDLATNGYMLLAERVRKEEERVAVKNILEKVMSEKGPKVTIDEEALFNPSTWSSITGLNKDITSENADVVWTRAMRRLFALVAHALRNNEPVLLIGETGCGKTTVCQLLADHFNTELHIVNAHQNTETGDLIGAQRPIRNRAAIEDSLRHQLLTVLEHSTSNDVSSFQTEELLALYDKLAQDIAKQIPDDVRSSIQVNRTKAAALFEWADGSLVYALKQGHYFLLDEISLADDSVLERLNSVLEPSRTLLLAEKGPVDSLVTAGEGFQFLATMNPGGDYGKKELSPALRNRFTEIWVPAMTDLDDILQIVRSKLKPPAQQYAGAIVSFSQWFNEKFNTSVSSTISIRDTLAWVSFVNKSDHTDPVFGIVHGAAMVFIDTLGANPAGLLAIAATSINDERKACLHHLSKLLGKDVSPLYFAIVDIASTEGDFRLGAFSIPKFSTSASESADFSLEAPTTRSNAMRVVRALQLSKPILLEGNPGVGKTTLVTTLAKAIGKPLTRLNLSEQTDLMDLFGSDVPVEGAATGTFAWRDAPFLQAMKKGDWVLLDEMNLASQSVLEGLNAVLDHRGEVYVSELDQTFHKHQDFRVFAAQNPHHQGGGRKGLPASFVNRFTVVYADVFRPEDLTLICKKVFPNIDEDEITRLIRFVAELNEQVVDQRAFGTLGAPWEFNLRDTLRWLQLLASRSFVDSARDFLDAVFVQRFRSENDRARLYHLFESLYGPHEPRTSLFHNLSSRNLQVGLGILPRETSITRPSAVSTLDIQQLGPMEALLISVKQSWPVIAVGPPGSGKTAMINQLATFVGADLITFSMNADVDAMDLVGGYEQVDPSREIYQCVQKIEEHLRRRAAAVERPPQAYIILLEHLLSGPLVLTESIVALLDSIAQFDTEATGILQHLHVLLQSANQQIEGARFQWVDGILIRALEQGKWLVLDNANLCSSAVLDRLNSLLEPNGYLSINEHSTADGEARIVRPHPNFRIFMTVDPRFGELSRAMRNRAVEIYLLEPEHEVQRDVSRPLEYPLQSALYRFRQFQHQESKLDVTLDHCFENLSGNDEKLLRSFTKQLSAGLASSPSSKLTNGGGDQDIMDVTLEASSTVVLDEKIANLSDFFTKIWTPHVQSLVQSSDTDHLQQIIPYHPLGNEVWLHSGSETKALGIWYSSMYTLMSELYTMQQKILALPSARFERRKERQKLPAFLHAYWKSLAKAVEAIWAAQHEGHRVDVTIFKPLQVLFWAFHQLITDATFDRATFQTYLKMLISAISPFAEQSTILVQNLGTMLSKQMAVFHSEVELTSGLGMEHIWRMFKPNTAQNGTQYTAVLELEGLADRLDAVMWKSNLRIDEMVQMRERITSSLDLVRGDQVDARELLIGLNRALVELEENIGEYDQVITPYFEEEFEGLCQYLDIAFNDHPITMQKYCAPSAAVIEVRAQSSLLARRPTKLTTVTVGRSYEPTSHFAKLYRHLGLSRQSPHTLALQSQLHTSLISKLHNADEVQLAQLDRFQTELQVLSQQLVLDADRITQDNMDALDRAYRDIYTQLYASHSVDIISTLHNGQVTFHPNAPISDLYRATLEEGFAKCHRSTGQVDASAWVQLGVFGLCLYVPNYPHDPALRPMIERKMFNKENESLIQALGALEKFQLHFTGQNTSFRIRQLEEAIQRMGEEPPVPAIFRPAVSELDDLQGEFTNLLSIIQPLKTGAMSIAEAAQDTTLHQNTLRIVQRLVEGYRAYDDITNTVVGFLVCLGIGLILAKKEEEDKSQSAARKSVLRIRRDTPFFGRQRGFGKSQWLLQDLDDGLNEGNHAIDLRWHALHSLSILKGVDSLALGNSVARNLLHDLFTSFYGDWKTKLLQDQEKQAQDSSLYTYRGMDDDVDEEDPSLFPDYEAEQNQEQDSRLAESSSREHAIRLANIHAELFVQGRDPSEVIKTLLEWCTTEMSRVCNPQSHGSTHDNALPTIFLALEKKTNALYTSGAGKTYNFYFDANLPEATRLIKLIHRIQARYRQIRNVWPEHQTLAEVLRTCDEALEFRHVDPVAKFITKAEKLHGYMYEWQKVASKEYSTASLYDDLTRLLISWRQLELTTWARLFDLEMDKCRDDTKSWFFIAYETIIAASESVEEDKMNIHAKDLLKSLEGFFLNTTLGQFDQRIKLLQQLLQHVSMRMQDIGAFKFVQSALENFLAYFSRLEKPVQEALTKGRQNLEKEVNDIIKLASWKDTNIEALKQSAKTSHRKLSKLVRKFRTLLNRPVSSIMGTGLPDENHILEVSAMSTVSTAIDETRLKVCADSLPNWIERPTRFKNLNVTVSMMRNLSTPNSDTVDGAMYITEFISDLSTSMVELQKATPPTLTEENKETVQHLKTQKRKLYADTMKELRQMGVNSNLSVDTLFRQDELSTILSTSPVVKVNGQFGAAAEYHLHKALNTMPQVRAVYKEHSGDLTPNDIARSIGYLEGLLHISIRQRGVLSKAARSLDAVQTPMSLIANLTQQKQLNWVSQEELEAAAHLQPNLRWLVAILKTGIDVVSAQAKLGKTNELDALLRSMRAWTTKIQDLADQYDGLPKLPASITSDVHQAWHATVKTNVSDIQTVFKDWMDNNDMARTVLRQVQPFLFWYPEVKAVGFAKEQQQSLEQQSQNVFAALDLILGSMQDVEAALKDLPTSSDDASWLVKEEQALSAALNCLHTPQISNALLSLLDGMQYLHNEARLRAFAAVFDCLRPILDQYVASHNYLVSRFDELHASTASLLHRLSKSFIQIGTQGFCQPPEKSSDQQKGNDEKLESGTGLGEGEGAEDISKDIEDDEDLEELAQEQKGEREGSIEEQDDAVDMGEQEMEGQTEEMGEKEDRGDESGEEGDDDVQSEVGSVDDLGPSAVDEKMWDEGGKDDDAKDKEGKEDVGTEDQEEQVAAEQKEKEKEKGGEDGEKEDKQEGEEDDEMEGEDQDENVGVGETEQMDPHAKEEETLDLPEDLNMDGPEDDGKEDDIGDMDMGDDLPEDEMDPDMDVAQPDTVDEEIGPEQEGEEEKETTGHVEDEQKDLEEDEDEEEVEEPVDDDVVPLPDENMPDDDTRDTKDTDQADPNAEAGAGTEANEEAHKNKNEQASASAANQDEGQDGESSEQKQETTAEDGQLGQAAQPNAGGHGEQPEETRETQSFKKLGDVLEKWYNQQKQISEAREKEETQVQQIDKEVDMADADFEHLDNEETQADTQALGTATEEQATALDHDMAMPVNEDEEKMPQRPEDNEDELAGADKDVEMEDAQAEQLQDQEEQQQPSNAMEGQPQAFVGEQKPFEHEDEEMQDAMPIDKDTSDTSSVHEVENQLSLTHLDPTTMTPDSARALWLSHEAATHSLSQQLTEHLRLILAPTLATKLRGDFRTGKRLNLKRIIPYIASGYKRDKIWLRRSQPSKRSYQVMIALDDSKSMAESGASNLAMKTLTLVTKSLSMLEVGEVSVVGFGDTVNVAHDFDKPFTSEAGVRVFEQFGFDAAKTNVRGLVDRSLELFAEARRKGSSSAGEDLWQLMLIVSDGICDSHAEIQRLVRKAQEERVMIVFVIIDSSAPPSVPVAPVPTSDASTVGQPGTLTKEKDKTSILDLQSVEITPEGKVVRWKYMERFPFRYYLVVRDVRELPGVLAGALRQWFGEVAGSISAILSRTTKRRKRDLSPPFPPHILPPLPTFYPPSIPLLRVFHATFPAAHTSYPVKRVLAFIYPRFGAGQ
ncbi:midasin [Pyrenochaeta sp. DS3sAY3a]|nr:midasin [Pyrenochaeta sp. DS3sAY3a]